MKAGELYYCVDVADSNLTTKLVVSLGRMLCYDLTSWLGETVVGWGQSRDYSVIG